jgi:hypothetical protein
MICLAAFASVTFQLTRQDRLAFYMTIDSRGPADRSAIGMFVGVRPLIIDRPNGRTLSFLSRIRQEVSRALSHHHIGGRAELDAVAQQRARWNLEPRRSLLIDYINAADDQPDAALPTGLNVKRTRYDPVPPIAAASLALTIIDTGKQLQLSMLYGTAIDQGAASSLLEKFEAELARIASDDDESAFGAQARAADPADPADPEFSPLYDMDGVVTLHVDLAEVRACLLNHPSITAAAAWVETNAASGSEVAASVTCASLLSDEELREFCRTWPSATQYMVPPNKILQVLKGDNDAPKLAFL